MRNLKKKRKNGRKQSVVNKKHRKSNDRRWNELTFTSTFHFNSINFTAAFTRFVSSKRGTYYHANLIRLFLKEYPGDKVTGPTYNVNSAGVSLYILLSPRNDFVGIFFAIYQRNIIQLINLSLISKRISFGKNYWKNIHPAWFEIFEN